MNEYAIQKEWPFAPLPSPDASVMTIPTSSRRLSNTRDDGIARDRPWTWSRATGAAQLPSRRHSRIGRRGDQHLRYRPTERAERIQDRRNLTTVRNGSGEMFDRKIPGDRTWLKRVSSLEAPIVWNQFLANLLSRTSRLGRSGDIQPALTRSRKHPSRSRIIGPEVNFETPTS